MRPRPATRTSITRLVGVLVLVASAIASCGSDEPGNDRSTPADSSAVCGAYDALDWTAPGILATDSEDEVVAKARRGETDQRRILDAATGDVRELAARWFESREEYRAQFLAERADAGGGAQLLQRARTAGFIDSHSYVESLAHDDPAEVAHEARVLRVRLAIECDGHAVADPPPVATSDAPAGTILAVKLGAPEIRRFSSTGDDLGVLELPDEVQAPIRDPSLSPDGRRLAFVAGTDDERLWIVDLDTMTSTSTTAVTCMDWDDQGNGLWAYVGTPPDDFVARIETDGTYDETTRLSTAGCPYRLDSTSLVMHRAPVDGAPTRIELVPKDGGDASELVANPCNLVAPHVSPDGGRLAITAGCGAETSSGIYLTSSDGTDLQQLFEGTATTATWSPDGAWLAFATYSSDAPGDSMRMRVLVASSDGSRRGAVTPPGYSWPTWVASQ